MVDGNTWPVSDITQTAQGRATTAAKANITTTSFGRSFRRHARRNIRRPPSNASASSAAMTGRPTREVAQDRGGPAGEAADQAGLSRRYGGIHFRDADLKSRVLGKRVALVAWRRAASLFRDRDR